MKATSRLKAELKEGGQYLGSQEELNNVVFEKKSVFLKIPIRIVSEANSNEHWHKKAQRHTIQKNLVRLYLKQRQPFHLPCNVTLTRYAPRKFDSDNLQTAFKYIRDAVSECITGCTIAGRADDDPRITWGYDQKKISKELPYITIEIS